MRFEPRYDTIGRRYGQERRTDPRIAARIAAALGSARSVLNVGAGTGSYEPPDRSIVAHTPGSGLALGFAGIAAQSRDLRHTFLLSPAYSLAPRERHPTLAPRGQLRVP